MTKARSSLKDIQLTENDIEYVLQLLTSKIANIETDIAIRSRISHDKLLDDLAWRYQNSLTKFIDEFHLISRHNFQNIEIDDVVRFKDANNMPDQYRAYLNLMLNIKDMICYDILNKPDVLLSLLTTERWLYLLKMTFEMNDFFLVTTICSALNSASIIKSGLLDKVSDIAKGIANYFGLVIPSEGWVYKQQKSKFDHGEDVVPHMFTLMKMMEGVEQQPNGHLEEVKKHINKEKRKFSNDFIDMQERLKTIKTDGLVSVINVLSRASRPDSVSYITLAKSIQESLSHNKVDLARLVKQIKLYNVHDDYYWLTCKLDKFIEELNLLATHFKMQTYSGSAARMQKCNGIKNILQDDSGEQMKLENIIQLMEDDVCHSSKKIKKILNSIAEVLGALVSLDEKRKWRSSSSPRVSKFFEQEKEDLSESKSSEKKAAPVMSRSSESEK